MRVIYTEQSFQSLEESMRFLLEDQNFSSEKVLGIRRLLLDRADSLAVNPYVGQYEEYLEHLEQGHRRLVEGSFKIIYRIEEEDVYITDFFDTRQSPSKMRGWQISNPIILIVCLLRCLN